MRFGGNVQAKFWIKSIKLSENHKRHLKWSNHPGEFLFNVHDGWYIVVKLVDPDKNQGLMIRNYFSTLSWSILQEIIQRNCTSYFLAFFRILWRNCLVLSENSCFSMTINDAKNKNRDFDSKFARPHLWRLTFLFCCQLLSTEQQLRATCSGDTKIDEIYQNGRFFRQTKN